MDSLEALKKQRYRDRRPALKKEYGLCYLFSGIQLPRCYAIKDGKWVKLEGLDEHPRNKGDV